jgi:hypothetical protein
LEVRARVEGDVAEWDVVQWWWHCGVAERRLRARGAWWWRRHGEVGKTLTTREASDTG